MKMDLRMTMGSSRTMKMRKRKLRVTGRSGSALGVSNLTTSS